LIILQLKSTQNESAFLDLSEIISYLDNEHGYKIRGHEIHQIQKNIEKLTLRQRADLVSSFCSKNDIEYLTYHVPTSRNEGQSISDERSFEKASNAIITTIKEAERVYEECRLENKVIIVYHLPSVISFDEIPYLNRDLKFKILDNAERCFLEFYQRNNNDITRSCTLTLENAFPKYFMDNSYYASINMYHPLEMIRLRKYGIKVTFDLSHYIIYSNYILCGKGNQVGDLDRQIYGSTAPSWNECIDLLGSSLVQLHINDGKGTDYPGEGLPPNEGEIPIKEVLQYINYGNYNNNNSINGAQNASTSLRNHPKQEEIRNNRPIGGTIELREGHLYNGELQRRAAEWLLANVGDVFY
jgi:hypothetical protein